MFPPKGHHVQTEEEKYSECLQLISSAMSGNPMENLNTANLEDSQVLSDVTPSSTSTFLSTLDCPGVYDFKVLPFHSEKASWVYSSMFHQVFIDMDKILMLQFRVNQFAANMFIRAVPVYSSHDDFSIPVTRCRAHAWKDDGNNLAHMSADDCLCQSYNLAGHVLRCFSFNAEYCFDKVSKRHSVRTPLLPPEPLLAAQFVQIPFSFMCKSSCLGLRKGPIDVVFTLENQDGLVFGRSKLAVKICSCPKRDKERMEKSARVSKLEVLLELPFQAVEFEGTEEKRVKLASMSAEEIKAKKLEVVEEIILDMKNAQAKLNWLKQLEEL